MTSSREKRKHKRIGYDMPLEFSLYVLDFKNLHKVFASGKGLDISDGGMGFSTDFPVEPGHILRIKKADGTLVTAMVRWVGELEGKYRVGVLIY